MFELRTGEAGEGGHRSSVLFGRRWGESMAMNRFKKSPCGRLRTLADPVPASLASLRDATASKPAMYPAGAQLVKVGEMNTEFSRRKCSIVFLFQPFYLGLLGLEDRYSSVFPRSMSGVVRGRCPRPKGSACELSGLASS